MKVILSDMKSKTQTVIKLINIFVIKQKILK